MEQKNKQRQSLKQKFLPYLVMKAQVFELPNTELNEFINDLIENNPFVDEGDFVTYEEFPTFVDFSSDDLYSFLKTQVEVASVDDVTKDIANKIIDNLDTSGFLVKGDEELIKEIKCSKQAFNRALKFVQTLEPEGVGSRSLAECFLIQLENSGPISKIEKQVIGESLDLLLKGDLKALSKRYGIEKEKLSSLREQVLKLEICPASQFRTPLFISHFPDIIIEDTGDIFRATVNKSSRRVIKLTENYARMIEKLSNKLDSIELDLLLKRAQWSLKAIEERDTLLEKIGQKIVDENFEFFKTHQNLKKLSIEDFISDGFDYTTFLRLIQNKYILTPCGMYPLRYFFRHKNEKFDMDAILKAIKEIIDNEDKKHPLTDSEIEKLLQEQGVEIKRRTITKYREKLNIPATSKRKLS